MKTIFALSLGLLLLASCGKGSAFQDATGPQSRIALQSMVENGDTNGGYQEINEAFFKPYCLRCHSGKYTPNISTYDLVIQNLDGIQQTVLVKKSMPIGKSRRLHSWPTLRHGSMQVRPNKVHPETL